MTLVSKMKEMQKALDKINIIRNSIVGFQTINWSEHIYPLVAALNEAGFEGMPYPEAKEYFGTLMEQRNELAQAIAGHDCDPDSEDKSKGCWFCNCEGGHRQDCVTIKVKEYIRDDDAQPSDEGGDS